MASNTSKITSHLVRVPAALLAIQSENKPNCEFLNNALSFFEMPTNIYVLVFVGEPLDLTKYRHTALFFEFSNGSTCAMHIQGAHGFFEFQSLNNYRPEQSRKLANKLLVATLQDHITETSIRDVVSRTSVRNRPADADWNCQGWVADALTRLVNHGYLNASQRASAIDRMTDACLEARDE